MASLYCNMIDAIQFLYIYTCCKSDGEVSEDVHLHILAHSHQTEAYEDILWKKSRKTEILFILLCSSYYLVSKPPATLCIWLRSL